MQLESDAHENTVDAAPTVVNCYEFFETLFPASGLLDLTDGMYYGDDSIPYDEAQDNQCNWLLDEVGCTSGSRILDIGCGNGRLVAAAQRRGADAVGITVSPQQVNRCRSQGLDVRLMNYRSLGDDWNGRFDSIIANGSIEHFVQPRDILARRQDEIYREMFEIFHRLLDPSSSARRVATTVIHQHDRTPMPPAEVLLRSPWRFGWKSPEFHFVSLQRGFGGSYPHLGQLERCAASLFQLSTEVDGTEDYRVTSEMGNLAVRKTLFSAAGFFDVWPHLIGFVARHPLQGATLLAMVTGGSWRWQFQGSPPPTRLLRQVWQYLE